MYVNVKHGHAFLRPAHSLISLEQRKSVYGDQGE